MDHVKNILAGYQSLLVGLVSPRDYVNSADGFYRDARNLQNDLRTVGYGLTNNVKRAYEQQDNANPR